MKEMASKTRNALVLFSGGLDSLLALKIIESLGIIPTALIFKSSFFDGKEALKLARYYNFKTIVRDFSKEHLEIVKTPLFGRGKNMNPCIDCHLLMLMLAKKIAKKEKYSLIATGEVLGQRPMSQNKPALKLIEKKSGLIAKILRPLSAKLLEKTVYEKIGLIDRKKLYRISGRTRKKQLELLSKYRITKFLTPGGGCILTDRDFSNRLKILLDKVPKFQVRDVRILRLGRNFWIGKNLIVIGRNQEDNEFLLKNYIRSLDTLMELKDYGGPTLLLRPFDKNKREKEDLIKIGETLAWYYPGARKEKLVKIKITNPQKRYVISVKPRLSLAN